MPTDPDVALDEFSDETLTAGDPLVWKGVAIVSGVLSAKVARGLLVWGWRKVRHDDPPVNPLSKETTWPEAIAFACVSGAVYGVGRMVAQRVAAGIWDRELGAPPPGLEKTS